ncbi:hypothetical protein Tco_0057933 [Tanacetum coccineum]
MITTATSAVVVVLLFVNRYGNERLGFDYGELLIFMCLGVAVVVRDFYKKFYNSLGSVPNHCFDLGFRSRCGSVLRCDDFDGNDVWMCDLVSIDLSIKDKMVRCHVLGGCYDKAEEMFLQFS